MDNPFEVGKNSYADVDLNILFGLEKYLRMIPQSFYRSNKIRFNWERLKWK